MNEKLIFFQMRGVYKKYQDWGCVNRNGNDQWMKLFFFKMQVAFIIIIIMSCRQHGYPWPSLATSPYHSSPPAGLLGYILCPHIAAVCKFGLEINFQFRKKEMTYGSKGFLTYIILWFAKNCWWEGIRTELIIWFLLT